MIDEMNDGSLDRIPRSTVTRIDGKAVSAIEKYFVAVEQFEQAVVDSGFGDRCSLCGGERDDERIWHKDNCPHVILDSATAAAREELEQMRAEIEEVKSHRKAESGYYREEITVKDQRIKELEEALRFYANEDNYEDGTPGPGNLVNIGPTDEVFEDDMGSIARRTLEQREDGK